LLTNDEIDHIVEGCIALKRESQKALYASFYGYAMAVCQRFASSEDEAMEIVNDGFLKLFKEISGFKPKYESHYNSLKGWLKQILIYTAIDSYRKNHKHSLHKALEEASGDLADFHLQAVDKMSYDELRRLVQRLSPAYRAVFNLFVIDGFSHDEISKMLGISVGTSKSNLAKAKMALQGMLKQLDGEIYGRRAV
jgi:RNA polymerase sigma factor (sigma-70 family)